MYRSEHGDQKCGGRRGERNQRATGGETGPPIGPCSRQRASMDALFLYIRCSVWFL